MVATAAMTLALTPATASATPDGGAPVAGDRQQAFAHAAAEYGVPENLLLAVSYLQSRWDAHGGQPSRGAGYGPMHLTDIESTETAGHDGDTHGGDARGDDSRPLPAADRKATQPDTAQPPAALRTLPLAAELTGLSKSALRTDPAANILGGAALLAHHQRTPSADPGAWYGAVARYSGADDAATAETFADEVYATLRTGASRVTDDGQRVTLRPTSVTPRREQIEDLGLRTADTSQTECPADLGCEWIAAPYRRYGPNPGDYGNHDIADRPNDLSIDYIVIHDTEVDWQTTLDLVQDPTYVSWQYTLRSHDGHVAQHVKHEDVAWQAGNWYVNTHSIGLEHEGYAAQGTWFTEAMYRSSAKLVRYLADRYDIPIDRAHIIGHDNVPAITPGRIPAMHWDPGPYWDWAHYFELLGQPFAETGTAASGVVTILPDYDTNQPAFTGCDTAGEPCPARGSSAVVLRSAPRDNAPLLNDVGLRPDGSPNTMHISDIGSRVSTGQQYAVADERGDWIAIWYLGQKGWLHRADTVWASGQMVTPKPGKDAIPVYGRAYPEASAYPADVPVQAIVPLPYTIAAGQRYVVGQTPKTDYYRAVTFDPNDHVVVSGNDRYYQIQLGHRVMYVRAADVDLVAAPA